DDATVSQISIDDTSGPEDVGSLTFSISLDQPSGFPISVHWQTADVSATIANNDYVAASGDVTFDPKATKKTVTVTIHPDSKNEPFEDLAVLLSANTGPSSILDGTGFGRILNDDATISQISIGDAGGYEDNGPLTFSISLDQASGIPISVHWQTV